VAVGIVRGRLLQVLLKEVERLLVLAELSIALPDVEQERRIGLGEIGGFVLK
jgi:hypothetical protein